MSDYQVGEPVVTGGLTVGGAITVSGDVDVGGAVTVSGGGATQITDTHTAPVGAPVVLIRGDDGLFRPDPATGAKAAWSDPVRFRPGVPADDPAAPEGAVQFDTTTGRGYRRREA